jgi:hypothetical protein
MIAMRLACTATPFFFDYFPNLVVAATLHLWTKLSVAELSLQTSTLRALRLAHCQDDAARSFNPRSRFDQTDLQ